MKLEDYGLRQFETWWEILKFDIKESVTGFVYKVFGLVRFYHEEHTFGFWIVILNILLLCYLIREVHKLWWWRITMAEKQFIEEEKEE